MEGRALATASGLLMAATQKAPGGRNQQRRVSLPADPATLGASTQLSRYSQTLTPERDGQGINSCRRLGSRCHLPSPYDQRAGTQEVWMHYLNEAKKFVQRAHEAAHPEVIKQHLKMAEWYLAQASNIAAKAAVKSLVGQCLMIAFRRVIWRRQRSCIAAPRNNTNHGAQLPECHSLKKI